MWKLTLGYMVCHKIYNLKTKKDPTIVQVFGMNVSWDVFNIPPSCIRNENPLIQ
jgi:hypothetical protein